MKNSNIRTVALLSVALFMFFLQGCSQLETPLDIPPTGTIQVVTTSDAKCSLYTANNLVVEWTGSKVIPGMKAGSYRVVITSDKFNSSFEESFELGVNEHKNLEPGTGGLDIKVKSDFKWELIKNHKLLFSGTGGLVIDTLWIGDYIVKIKVNPLLPDYETTITVIKQQVKVVEPLLGSFTIKTKSDYQNVLFFEGVEQFTWTGTKEFNPWVVGNYVLKSKMFTTGASVNQSFSIQPNDNKIIEWSYGKISLNAFSESFCKLKRDGIEQLWWQGNKSFDSLITGNYSIEIQEASNHPVWSENFTLNKDEDKNITLPYASIQVTSNVPASQSKLIYNGKTIKTITGNGIILWVVPGEYILSNEAWGFTTSSYHLTISNGQILSKNFQLNPTLIPMVHIPSATFTMGCYNEQSGCNNDEKPTHSVTLSAYEIGKYEVTQKEWLTIMSSNPSGFTGDNRPVERVSWNDAIEFCNRLSRSEGFQEAYSGSGSNITCDFNSNGYRLPTEAEWEYAARGGSSSTNTKYSGSNTLESVAWYSSNSLTRTHAVGTKSPNQLGIYDMSGNVFEFCWDWYSSTYYNSANQTNPKGPVSGSNRIMRGGSWGSFGEYCRVANRSYNTPSNIQSDIGFRVVRTKN